MRSARTWGWVPSLYFAEGMPYALVITVSVIMYKRLGISNTDIALYTSWLYLPWIIKPLWSPLVDMLRTKRFWILAMQLLIGGSLACVALTLTAPDFFRYSLAVLWLMAFSSATHDIAADGFYMLGLKHTSSRPLSGFGRSSTGSPALRLRGLCRSCRIPGDPCLRHRGRLVSHFFCHCGTFPGALPLSFPGAPASG